MFGKLLSGLFRIEPKPCPSCGKTPKIESGPKGNYRALCSSSYREKPCGCEGPFSASIRDAVRSWNRMVDVVSGTCWAKVMLGGILSNGRGWYITKIEDLRTVEWMTEEQYRKECQRLLNCSIEASNLESSNLNSELSNLRDQICEEKIKLNTIRKLVADLKEQRRSLMEEVKA